MCEGRARFAAVLLLCVLKRGVAWRDVERPPREDLLRDVMPRGVFDLDRVILGSTLVGAWLF